MKLFFGEEYARESMTTDENILLWRDSVKMSAGKVTHFFTH